MSNDKQRKITHEGILTLTPELNMPCYVLEDGTRVISSRGMQNVLKLGNPGDEGKQEEQKSGVELSRFINTKWFNELIANQNELEHFEPIVCYKGHQKINGYEATALVDFCNIILQARKEGRVTTVRRILIAEQSEILIRSFAKVGIIALVDEATGYQYDREKAELQAILQTFISEEILKWQETFQLSFYKEIFRLWGVPFTAANIKRKPMFIGKLTNELVYKNMPKGIFVLDKLKEKTPKTQAGNYKYRLHQSLTPDAGREALKKVIYSVEALASVSETKDKFLKLMKDKYNPDMQLKLFADIEKEDDKKQIQLPDKLSDFNQKLTKALNYNPKKDKLSE